MRLAAFLLLLLVPACGNLESVQGPSPAPVVTDCTPGGCFGCPTARPAAGTLTVIGSPGQLNVGQPWVGWWSARVQSTANTNGRVYPIELRWNMPHGHPTATAVLLVGGGNRGWGREAYRYGQALDDSLARRGIRSVHVSYLAGADAFPRNGWVNISSTLADAIRWARRAGIVEGDLLGYGNSGGATMIAAALLAQSVDFRVVALGGGPFAVDADCPPAAVADWLYEDIGPCTAVSQGTRRCRSLSLPGGRRLLPWTDVAVLVGSQDQQGAYIRSQGASLLSMLAARRETMPPVAAPHAILNSPAGLTAILAAVDGRVL